MYSHLVLHRSAALRHRLYKSLWEPYKETSAIVRKKRNVLYINKALFSEKIITIMKIYFSRDSIASEGRILTCDRKYVPLSSFADLAD